MAMLWRQRLLLLLLMPRRRWWIWLAVRGMSSRPTWSHQVLRLVPTRSLIQAPLWSTQLVMVRGRRWQWLLLLLLHVMVFHALRRQLSIFSHATRYLLPYAHIRRLICIGVGVLRPIVLEVHRSHCSRHTVVVIRSTAHRLYFARWPILDDNIRLCIDFRGGLGN